MDVPGVARERAVPIRFVPVFRRDVRLDVAGQEPAVRAVERLVLPACRSGALRYDVARVVIQPKTGSFLLYAPGTASPRSSFRSIQGPASADHTGLTGPTTTSPTDAPGSGTAGSSGPDLVVIGVSVGVSLAVVLIIAMLVVTTQLKKEKTRILCFPANEERPMGP